MNGTGNDKATGKAHALLSASSSHRWMECTPSAVAESGYADEGSEFAREGTLAHAIGARMLKERLGRDHADEDREIEELDRYRTGEMDEYAEGYANFVEERLEEARVRAVERGELNPSIMVEARLDFSDWVPDGFGTGDAVIIGGGMLEVIDLKYGRGVEVSAERNPQMMLYALGAGSLFDYLYDFEKVRMTIYQPRLGNISTWEMDAAELQRWAEERLKPLAEVAARGLGARRSGEWCRFCKAKGACSRLATDSLALHELAPDSDELTVEELPGVLAKAGMVRDWLTAVEERALKLALGGSAIEGYKLVEGRSVRKVTDPEGAAAALIDAGGTEEQVWKPKELRTLTELERTFGKKSFAALCGSYITKPQGKPTLVPESDKRKALNPAADFSGMI